VIPLSDEDLRRRVEAYFEGVTGGPPELRAERVRWRTYCFENGLEYGQYVKNSRHSLDGKRVLDVACGWGGHALALASHGAKVVAADLNDFSFATLTNFANQQDLTLAAVRCTCERLPFASSSFDLVLALELVEHIPDPQEFASEVARVLRPGGMCILSTPPRLRSLLYGEPHYGLRGITILPLSWQRRIATSVFGRSYPFPIARQYMSAGQVLRPFRRAGLDGTAVLGGNVSACLGRVGIQKLGEVFFWKFLVVARSPETTSSADIRQRPG
jgi:SAM-dependent methyltransferase